MDPISSSIGFGIGVVSIASIFQTCLHGYRSLLTAMAIGDDAVTLDIQFQVEQVRLFSWGRNWGLVKVEESKGPRFSDSESDSEDEPDKNRNAGPKEEIATFLDTVDEDLEIPGLRDLTIEILGRIYRTLEEWKKIAQKYGAVSSAQKSVTSAETSGKKSTKELLSKIDSKQASRTKEISNRNKITSKLRWALKDKQDLEELLARLTNLNGSLEKLLPNRERVSLARGLTGEMLAILEDPTINTTRSDIDEQLSHLKGKDEIKAARIVLLKHANLTERAERSLDEEQDRDPANGPTPFAKPSVWIKGTPGSMQIPFDDFVRLAEPKMKDHQVHKHEGRDLSGRYAPMERSLAVYSPISRESVTPETIATGIADKPQQQPAQTTLIEWRPVAHESTISELTEKDLQDRRDHIARLLHRISITDSDFRVLDCLGYTTASGHTADGETHGLVGYVYRYPSFASPKSLPISLRDILGKAYASDQPNIPPLEERFRLARNLAIALYQLQCAGWVHRKISSYNVIFFKDTATGELALNQPFLTGWQYSRPDDQRRLFPSERASEAVGDLDMYIHRKRLVFASSGKFPRYRKSFDIYSLGIILMEIAFWEPIFALTSENERKAMEKMDRIESGLRAKDWWKMIWKTAQEELAPEMGIAYRDAVLLCLQGLGYGPKKEPKQTWKELEAEREARERYYVDDDFEEVGIEREFYWKVLKPLERFGM